MTGDPTLKAPAFIFVANRLHSGGAEKQLLLMARTLAAAGCQCTILELKHHNPSARIDGWIRDAANAGVTVEAGRKYTTYLGAWFRLRSLLQRNPRSILWTWGYRADALALLQGDLLGKYKWLCSLRSANAEVLLKAKWFVLLRDKWVTGYIANTWANCQMLGSICANALPKCHVVYNAIEGNAMVSASLPRELPQPLRVVMLGNVDRFKKGYDFVLLLAERVKSSALPVEIHIAGRLDSGDWLPTEIARRKLGQYLIYEGEAKEPLKYLSTGHVYLLLSRLEGTPNALLEATSLGLPAIATKVGDLEVLAKNGVDLRLIPIGGVDQAYDAIGEILSDWPGTVAMGMRGRAWCERLFREEACRVRLLEVVNQLCVSNT